MARRERGQRKPPLSPAPKAGPSSADRPPVYVSPEPMTEAEEADLRRRFTEGYAGGRMVVLPATEEGQGRWVGGANPDAHRHRCEPPMRHVGCCDGTGGHTVTEEEAVERAGVPIPLPAGTRTVCISGRPDGSFGARWLCNCGQGWRIGDACDVADAWGRERHSEGHHRNGGGMCIVGTAWRRLGAFASWRLRRAARRAA